MSESTASSQAESISASKSAIVEINENTLNNVAIPEINKVLVERINPDFGILDKLLASKALSRAEKEEVKNLSTSHLKNARLLEVVTKNEKLKEFFNALRDTHQEHLVNYVTAKGEYSLEYGGAWPLMEKETSILDVNQESLIDVLDITGNELVNKLYQLKVLNRRQKEFICNKSCDFEKAEVLLDFLYRSSMSDYSKMITCLIDNNQQHVANILFEGGALVRVHNDVTGETEADTAAENEIVDRIESMLSNMNLEDSSRFMERLHLKLFAARAGHSVNLYILCETVDELMHLSDLLTSRELQRGIETLFNRLVSRSERIHVLTTVSQETLDKCKMFLEVDRSQEKVSSKDILKLEQMKVHEKHRTDEEEDEEPMDDEQTEEEVESKEEVDAGGSHSGVEEMHEEALQRELSEEEALALAAADEEKHGTGPVRASGPRTPFEVMAAIMRNNTDYFLEYMRSRGLIDRLHADGCLTDEETRYIKTLKEDSDKNDEILKVVRGHGIEKYNVLIDFLRILNQNLVAEVAEKGGVVMKATISNEEDNERIEKLVVDRINQLLNKTSSRSTKLVEFLSLLGRGNIQILNAKWEYGIIVWFWCRSENALKAVDDMNESDDEQLTKLMTELFKILLDGGESIPKIMSIDLEDPDKMLVARTSSISLEKDLLVPKCSVCAVAMLGSNIYILREKPSCLLVIEEGDPSKQSEIPLTVIKDPVDVVASQQSACLYITDRGNNSVWKFTPTDSSVTSWLQNISIPYTLSVTSNGGVIRVEQGKPSHLDIYSADAQRINHIQLPDIVKVPHHAVETSAGTYVISYGEESGKNGVCEITRDGKVVSVFDTLLEAVEGADFNVNKCLKETFAEKKLVCCPRYLAVNEHGEIYATDPVNDGLMVFDSRLKLEAIIGKDLVKEPVNVHCLKNMRRLLIVYSREKQQTVGLFSQKLT